jgi:hydroxymethylpyrimidine pyrophosphatase-like HAD family hydrolase
MLLENNVALLCIDLAGTLVHPASVDDSDELISIGGVRRIHPKTITLLSEIMNAGTYTLLATGMRFTNYEPLQERVPHNQVILEHGGVIFRNGIVDQDWNDLIRMQRPPLSRYQRAVENAGLRVDVENRQASFRLLLDPEAGFPTFHDVAYALQTAIQLPDAEEMTVKDLDIDGRIYPIPIPIGVSLFTHMPQPPPISIEVIPEASGKKNAIEFLMKKLGFSWNRTIAAGNDRNDEDMLRAAGVSYALVQNSAPLADVPRIYIAKGNGHCATIEVLEHILNETIPRIKQLK